MKMGTAQKQNISTQHRVLLNSRQYGQTDEIDPCVEI